MVLTLSSVPAGHPFRPRECAKSAHAACPDAAQVVALSVLDGRTTGVNNRELRGREGISLTRTKRWVSAGLVALALAVAPAMLLASDDATAVKDQKVSTAKFTVLKSVQAEPMSSNELKTVKGQHVHFLTLSNGKIHFAGNPFEHNWENLGGTDGQPVAPSYKGLCVAHGNGSIFIPTNLPGTPPTPVTLQCPPGS